MFTRRLRRPPESAPYHAKRVDERPVPRYRPVLATLTLAGLRVSELCALNCEHVDLGRRELRVLDAKTRRGTTGRHPRRPSRGARRVQGGAPRYLAASTASIPERARQALDP
jgi:integrase